MKIIGLSGKKYSGKDTFYSVLKKIDSNMVRVAFADCLKDEVYEMVLKPNQIERSALDDSRKKYFRLILQGWGGEFRRQFNSDTYWLDKCREKVDELERQGFTGTVVITDVRYQNEAQWIKDSGGTLVRINRPRKGLIGWFKDKLGIVPDKHMSECDLDKCQLFDMIINNSGKIEDLSKPAEALLDMLG